MTAQERVDRARRAALMLRAAEHAVSEALADMAEISKALGMPVTGFSHTRTLRRAIQSNIAEIDGFVDVAARIAGDHG